jgi:hypothetical protein
MKYLCAILLLICCETAFAQKKEKETRVPCIAYWKKGETKAYLITRKKEKTSGGKTSTGENFSIETKITVVDSTAEGYTVHWVYSIPPELEKGSMMHAVAQIMDGLKFVYKTDDVGSFTELVNWEEIRDFYIDMLKLQLQGQAMDSTKQKIVDETLAIFQKREVIESMAIKEIQLFHAPYGLMFSTKDTSVNTAVTIPVTDEPMPAIQSWRITEVGQDGDNFRLVITQNIDPTGVGKVIESIMKKYAPGQKADVEEIRKALLSFRVDDFSEYRFVQSTGWLREYNVTRTGASGDMTQIETYKMELRRK